jgi:hypothetical protein
LPPELVEEHKERKQEVIQILRENEELRRTRKIQSECQVFELVRGYFGKGDEA